MAVLWVCESMLYLTRSMLCFILVNHLRVNTTGDSSINHHIVNVVMKGHHSLKWST